MTTCKGSVLLFSNTVLLAVLTGQGSAAAQQDPLGLIAPGLTAQALCPLVKSDPRLSSMPLQPAPFGPTIRARMLLPRMPCNGRAVVAANAGGCINEVFEGVNQAIIKGGFKVSLSLARPWHWASRRELLRRVVRCWQRLRRL
ncbi:hypothetical protein COO60DRAFT_724464 [Scenedesmus sp. NREL 46B-D3]|nr:hypothetical protein COO60DRAFT_724464 [Scenedesmus sp. NREL 46B-D3]